MKESQRRLVLNAPDESNRAPTPSLNKRKELLLGVDPTVMLHDALRGDRRPPDGKLHPSGDLIGPLRHSMLRAAGAPTIESEVVSDTRLMTGTLWHSYFEEIWHKNRMPVMTEVRLDNWLPEGWSGTADWLVWNQEYEAFVLGDLKTIKGEGIKYVKHNGIKEEHLWQLSAYWYALEKMGLPILKGFGIFYLPMNAVARDEDCEPILCEADPLPRETIHERMTERWAQTQEYLMSLIAAPGDYLTPALAPVQERVQALRWNAKSNVWDLKLVPHWSASYCPYPNELCDCSEAGQTKIGHYKLTEDDTLEYVPRKDYEDVTPTRAPDAREVRKKRKEVAESKS